MSDVVARCKHKKLSALDADLFDIHLHADLITQIRRSAITDIYFTNGLGTNGAFKLFYTGLVGLLISLCSIYIAYKSLVLSATEKGAQTEAKVVSDLKQTGNGKDISVSIQNVSNTQVGVNSAYVLVMK